MSPEFNFAPYFNVVDPEYCIMAEMTEASSSAILNFLQQSNTINLFAAILSGLSGGFFAGFFANIYESGRRIRDKRHDKYFEHRNSLVQIEQECIPLRMNISRNITALTDAIDNTHETNIRFILRFYKLSLSSGLGMKLLSVDLINDYAQLYSAIEALSSDIDHVSGLVTQARENGKAGVHDQSIVESYKTFLPHLKEQAEEIDKKSLELLSICQLALKNENKKIKEKYIKDGKEIKYVINSRTMNMKMDDIKKQEDFAYHPDEKRPKFIAPYLDLKLVLIVPKQPSPAT